MLPNHTVIVEGDRVAAVGPSVDVAILDGATVIDGEGAYLMVRENPLSNISATRDRVGVMTRGKWYTQEELDGLVAELVASY